MRIISIRQSDRGVRLELEGGASLLLPPGDDEAAGLSAGDVIDDERVCRIMEKADDYRCYLCAVASLARRDRSRREMLLYLGRKGFSQERSRGAVDLLCGKGYMDDLRYARMKAENLSRGTVSGRSRIERKLREKGIDRETICQAMAGMEEPPYEEILSLAGKKWAMLKDKKNPREKMIRFLTGRGFSPGTIRHVLRDLQMNDEPPPGMES